MRTYIFLGIVACVLAGTCGCAQNSDSNLRQANPQNQSALTDQAAAGSQTTVEVAEFQPDLSGLARALGAASQPSGSVAGSGGDATSAHTDLATSGGGLTIGTLTVAQNVTVHSGGSTTGAQSSGGASGQSATPTGTIGTDQVQRPSASVAVPVAVALPGGVAQPNAQAANAAEGSTSSPTLTPSQQAEARALIAKVRSGESSPVDIARLAELLLGPATTQPAAAPR